MIHFEEALKKVNASVRIKEIEQIHFTESLGRVLAEDVRSDIDMPPFDKSAMDGYACRMEDLPNELEVIELIPAGKKPEKLIGKNQCAKIMTGSPMPGGADCVIMVEHTEEVTENKIRFTAEKTKPNFVFRGEDIKKDELVIKRGTLIKPQHIAVLASMGKIQPLVYQKPSVAVLSTGDELVEPNQLPAESKIRNSNAYQLIAQVERMSCVAKYMGIAEDNPEHSREMISKAIKEHDVLLLTGGVSMGDFDFIPAAINELGFKIMFKSLAVQPGRPTVFAGNGEKYIFGLPGNPVSSFNIFELLVKPLLFRMMDYSYEPLMLKLRLGEDYSRKKSSRLSFLPVRINSKGEAVPVKYHGSAHIHSLICADALLAIPIGKTILKKGEMVDVRQI